MSFPWCLSVFLAWMVGGTLKWDPRVGLIPFLGYRGRSSLMKGVYVDGI